MTIRRLLLLLPLLIVAGCADSITEPVCTPTPFTAGIQGDTITLASGLRYLETAVGTGVEARAGDRVLVHYTGTLRTGAQFDSSRGPGRGPLDFIIGTQDLIAGFDQGVRGMRVGGTRRILVPHELGYGSRPPATIPACATLIFDLELVTVVGS